MQIKMRTRIVWLGVLACGIAVAIAFIFGRPLHSDPVRVLALQVSPASIFEPEQMIPAGPDPERKGLTETASSRRTNETPRPSISGKYAPLEQDGFRKGDGRVPITEFPRTGLGKTNYALVRGLHASLARIEQLIELAFANGIYYYDSRSARLLENAVFDKTVEKVGFWSGEISLDGSETVVDEVKKRFDLELINEEHGRAIFRAGPRFSLEGDYPTLVKLVSPGQVRLDVRFAKLVRQ